MSQKLYEEANIQAIADAIRSKNGLTDTYKTSEMAAAITAIEGGGGGGADLPSEAYTISGDCRYRFAYNGWNWFIENYGSQITTNDITNAYGMFTISDSLTEIPFELNFNSTNKISLNTFFQGCSALTELPKINNCQPDTFTYFISGCFLIRDIPSDYWDNFIWTALDNMTASYTGNSNSMFRSCYSLRSFPLEIFNHMNKAVSYSGNYFYGGFYSCFVLDELLNLPIPYTSTWTSNAFVEAFGYCERLKNLTFALSDGQPYVMNWKSQTIDLSTYVGYSQNTVSILNYNSGITSDKQVTDDTTYQALKDDPDWFTTDVAYSRYNHDSAVATINSLPDTSAYLTANGGTNTIKFKGEAGSATDGGAINTLTEEEIAVATAKGWTVTLV